MSRLRRQPVIELEPSRHYEGELDLVMGDEHMTHRTAVTSADLDALRDVLGLSSGRERGLAAVRFLAALDDRELREALLMWKYEQPAKAARLLALLTGEAEPAWKAAAGREERRG